MTRDHPPMMAFHSTATGRPDHPDRERAPRGAAQIKERNAVHEFFPGNYRWSYNTHLALAAGGPFGDVALILPELSAASGTAEADEAWHLAWAKLAGIAEARGLDGLTGNSRSEALFLSALYHTIAEHFIPPADPKRLESYGEVLRTFDLARDAAPYSVERVLVPYEGTTLPGYFMPAAAQGPAPTVIFICGLDTTKELWFLRARRQFTDRGMNCLFIDTPGIGEALRLQSLYTRHDYEKPVSAIVDYLVSRSEVDPDRIGLIGSSLGGYYVSRAAAFEPRLAATIAWGANYDYHRVWIRRMTTGGLLGAPKFQIMFITGTDSVEEAVEKLVHFRLEEFAERISCPFLIMHGADDLQVSIDDAKPMLDVIGSQDKELKVFDGINGGSAHTQFDNHLPALHFAADWMAGKLDSGTAVRGG